MDPRKEPQAPNELSVEQLEQLAYAMARAIPDLDCPECCDQGWRYQYMEMSAQWYREEWEWACLVNTLIHYRNKKRLQG